MLEALDLHSIADERARERVRRLLNMLADVMADLRASQAEHQHLRHEINRRKGEQGTPKMQANTPPPLRQNHASAQERRQPKAWSKRRKTAHLPLDRAQGVPVDPDRWPPAAQCKGDEEVVVQDVLLRTDNVLCQQEKFSSPSQHTPSLASLPQG